MKCIIELISELTSAGQCVLETETKRALLRGLPYDCYGTAESIMTSAHNYFAVIPKLVFRETRLETKDGDVEKAMLNTFFKTKGRCYACGKKFHVMK